MLFYSIKSLKLDGNKTLLIVLFEEESLERICGDLELRMLFIV